MDNNIYPALPPYQIPAPYYGSPFPMAPAPAPVSPIPYYGAPFQFGGIPGTPIPYGMPFQTPTPAAPAQNELEDEEIDIEDEPEVEAATSGKKKVCLYFDNDHPIPTGPFMVQIVKGKAEAAKAISAQSAADPSARGRGRWPQTPWQPTQPDLQEQAQRFGQLRYPAVQHVQYGNTAQPACRVAPQIVPVSQFEWNAAPPGRRSRNRSKKSKSKARLSFFDEEDDEDDFWDK